MIDERGNDVLGYASVDSRVRSDRCEILVDCAAYDDCINLAKVRSRSSLGSGILSSISTLSLSLSNFSFQVPLLYHP